MVFKLDVKCKVVGQTLDVTSRDLISSDPSILPVYYGTIRLDCFRGEIAYLKLTIDQNDPGVTLCKLRYGQEVKLTCIAKKVNYSGCNSAYFNVLFFREFLRSMLNGHLLQQSDLSMILIIIFAIYNTGSKKVRTNGKQLANSVLFTYIYRF